jgi:hypothetical protein
MSVILTLQNGVATTIIDLLLFILFAKKLKKIAIFQAYKRFVDNQIGKKIKMLSF